MSLKKITFLGLLMMISELLLIAFVIWWLTGQFSEEETALKKNLYEEFTRSRDQVIDSVLVKNLINPVLQDQKANKKIEIVFRKDSLPDSLKLMPGNFVSYANNTEEKIMYEENEPASNHSERDTAIRKNVVVLLKHDSSDNLLLHGVRLFVNEMSNVPGEKRRIQQVIAGNADTMLLKKLLTMNLEKNGWHFSLRWVSGISRSADKKQLIPLYFESDLFPNSYGVEISGYTPFLLKRIIPQGVFALILLLLTAAAFLTAYGSLRNQIRLSTTKDNFISNISHELKTPVSTVKVALEALQDLEVSKNEKMTQDYLRMASLEMDRLELLIGKILNTFLLESNGHAMTLEKTSLDKLVEEVLESFRLRFVKDDAFVNFTPPEESLYVNIDKLYIQGVLVNLLDNSLKYADKKPEINIHLSAINDNILLLISDNGPGIPYKYTNKIFEKFFRVPTGNRHNVKGYGLGLTYAAEIMKQHNGQIRVENLPAGGCAFKLIFQRAL